MVLGRSVSRFTLQHVLISRAGVGTGFALNGKEPPFAAAQLPVMGIFIGVGIVAAKRLRVQPAIDSGQGGFGGAAELAELAGQNHRICWPSDERRFPYFFRVGRRNCRIGVPPSESAISCANRRCRVSPCLALIT